MSLKIRLSRGGSKKRPFYRIVVADSRMPRDGRYLEKVGTYNPMLPKEHEDRLKIFDELVVAWIAKGAKATDRVARLLSQKGLVETPTQYPQTKKSEPKAKTKERLKEKQEKAAALAEAAKDA